MKTKELSTKKMVLYMRLLYFIFWGTMFISHTYIPIYLREFAFINDFTLGMILSGGFLITTAAQIFFGNLADRSKTKNKVLTFAQIGLVGGLILLSIPKHSAFITLLPAVFLFYIFFVIPGLLMDTIVVENAENAGVAFGTLKCFASAGACAMALALFLMSLFMELRTQTAFILAISCAVLSLLPARRLPPTKGYAKNTGKGGGKAVFKEIIKNRKLMLLLCYVLLLFMGIQATNVFMGVYYASPDGMGAGLGMYGLFFAICIGFETALMLYGNRFLQAMDISNVFTLVSVAAFSRSLILFLAPNIYVLQLCAISQALIFAPLWSRLSPYVNEIVSKEMRATGQAAWSVMAFGIGPMVGAALGGMIANAVGMRSFFGVVAAMLLVVSVVFFFLFRRQRKNEQDLNPE